MAYSQRPSVSVKASSITFMHSSNSCMHISIRYSFDCIIELLANKDRSGSALQLREFSTSSIILVLHHQTINSLLPDGHSTDVSHDCVFPYVPQQCSCWLLAGGDMRCWEWPQSESLVKKSLGFLDLRVFEVERCATFLLKHGTRSQYNVPRQWPTTSILVCPCIFSKPTVFTFAQVVRSSCNSS